MSPSNPCKVKVSLQHLDLYIKDLNHNSIVFISLLLGDKHPSMKKQLSFGTSMFFLLHRMLKLSKSSCTFGHSHRM